MSRTADLDRVTKTRRIEDLPLVLTIPEVAAVLRCSVSHVRHLMRTGRLPRLDTDGVALIARRTLANFLDTPQPSQETAS